MKINITAKHLNISPAITNRITKKTEKMGRYLPTDTEVNIHLVKENDMRRNVEITVPMPGITLRAEAKADNNLYLAIDSALAKIERQIHKHKNKLSKSLRKDAFVEFEPEYIEEFEPEAPREVVKRKTFTVRPMSLEDAIMQMELLGHNFFVYVDIDTLQSHVLYLRKDGNLGLLEPEK